VSRRTEVSKDAVAHKISGLAEIGVNLNLRLELDVSSWRAAAHSALVQPPANARGAQTDEPELQLHPENTFALPLYHAVARSSPHPGTNISSRFGSFRYLQ
jgi:hypothetical protein